MYRRLERFTPPLVDRPVRPPLTRRSLVRRPDRPRFNGIWRYVYRVIDRDDHVMNVPVEVSRDGATTRRFIHRALIR
jgi:hypothetical protein